MQDNIYVASGREIYIFEDKAPYRLLDIKNLGLPRSQNPLELAACPVHKCLYIGDLGNSCVRKMSPANGHQLEMWLNKWVWRLSVTSDGKVLVLDNDLTHPQLRIYTSGAELESSVPLRGDSYLSYMYSRAAVEVMPGVVAVQYEKLASPNNLKGIVVMHLNATGEILCDDLETKRISSLASYSPGRLIAADQESKQVIVLDRRLKPLQVLLSPATRMLQWPQFLCYRRDSQELIVNHFDLPLNQFNVYKLSYDDG